MAFKIAVCDDAARDRDLLVSFIKTKLPFCEVLVYESGEALLWDVENRDHIDILFLDIFMDGMSGIEAARRIRKVDPDALLIFVSSSEDFYRDSYDLYAFNYLNKPINMDRFNDVLSRAVERLNKEMDMVISFSFNNELHRVHYSELLYLSSEGHIVNFHLKNGDVLKAYGKLDDYAGQLSSEIFLRCHQSYIVNLSNVTSLRSSEFAIGEIRVPVSRSYSGEARDKYRSYMFGDF